MTLQDCGDLTPTVERLASFPRSSQGKDKSQFCALVRKLSEVEGLSPSTILRSMGGGEDARDEGVELEACSSQVV